MTLKNSSVKTESSYRELFDQPTGQKVLIDLLKSHGVLNSCFVPGDPYSSAFNEGARSVVLRILRRSKIDIKKLMKMVDAINKENEESL